MNDLYCYFLYVGQWKDISPEQVIITKRRLDKLVYSNSPFFSSDFLKQYENFMGAMFKTGTGWALDAKLKSPPIRDKDRGKEPMFAKDANGYIDNTTEIFNSYFSLLGFAAKEMDVEVKAPLKPRTPSEGEIQERLNGKP